MAQLIARILFASHPLAHLPEPKALEIQLMLMALLTMIPFAAIVLLCSYFSSSCFRPFESLFLE